MAVSCVCGAAKALVEAVRPELIYRATYLSNPPHATLVRHRRVTDTLRGLGYDLLDDGADTFGRKFWLMVRIEDG